MSAEPKCYSVKKKTGWASPPPRSHSYLIRDNLTLQEARDIVSADDTHRQKILDNPKSTYMDKKQANDTRCYISRAGSY